MTAIADDAAHLLIVDDDRRIRSLLSRYLSAEGYRVSAASSAAEATSRLENFVFDLIVLDVMMPNESGLVFARKLRGGAPPLSEAPILMLTALSEMRARVEGLEAGADDYLGKPFEPRELSLRIASILKRTRPRGREAARLARFGDFAFDHERGILLQNGAPVHLTTRERDLLRILASEAGPVSRGRLAQRDGCAGDGEGNERSVDVEIARLRRKLASAAHCLQTVRGRGYRLVTETKVRPAP